jgi:hypothetical protein
MSSSKPYIQQLLNEIRTISSNVFERKKTIVYVNDWMKSKANRLQLEVEDSSRVWPDLRVFHKDDSIIGVHVKDRENAYLFEQVPDAKATVMVYWKTWLWYGNFKHVCKTLSSFFKEFKDKDNNSPLECCVCLEASEELRMEYVFHCDHQFCIQCVPKIAGGTCPLCRSRSLTK